MTQATWESTISPSSPHRTVLLNETVAAVLGDGDGDGVYIDGTYGRGGHSRLLLSQLSAQARVLAFDKDPQAIEVAQAHAQTDPRLTVVHGSFAAMAQVLAEQGLGEASVQGVLLDLGVSSPQIDTPERGFSFRFDGPLDMRMDPTRGMSVADWLIKAPEKLIAEVIREYGEERFAVQVAKAIVARRQSGESIRSTRQLAQIVADAVKTREPGQDPATRTFQAFRIFINAELEELEQGLTQILHLLKPGGRLAVISFHSLEDRIVKQFIVRHSRSEVDRRVPFAPPKACLLEAPQRLRPSVEEVAANPRSRSAILRVAQRTAA